MFIIFNKEYRKYESIMSDLMKKMKKSVNVEKVYEVNTEVYKLDSVDIVFEFTGGNKLVIKDKSGSEIISLDCYYDRYDELQSAKWDLFSGFLGKIRGMYEKRIETVNKLKAAAEKAKKAEEAKQKAVFAQQAKEKLLNDALEKLRGL